MNLISVARGETRLQALTTKNNFPPFNLQTKKVKIKAIIKADLEAQKKVKEAEDKIQNALLSMVKDKDSINKEVFDRARQFVEDERKKLLDQLALTEQEGQAKYDASLKELESQFKTNQEKWLAELFERSINFEAE